MAPQRAFVRDLFIQVNAGTSNVSFNMEQNKTPEKFREWLDTYFINEVDPTTHKDNFEDRFDVWVSDLQYDDWVKLGQKYAEDQLEEMREYYAYMGGNEE